MELKNILFLTPHQISTEALSLKRAGVSGFDFIDELNSNNYYSESKQIPQVVDGEIYLTKGKIGRKDWALFIGKGKHRSPVITPDEFKKVMLRFPEGAPIPEDIHDTEEVTVSEESSNTGKGVAKNDFDF